MEERHKTYPWSVQTPTMIAHFLAPAEAFRMFVMISAKAKKDKIILAVMGKEYVYRDTDSKVWAVGKRGFAELQKMFRIFDKGRPIIREELIQDKTDVTLYRVDWKS